MALLGPVAMIGVPALANRALGAPVEAPAFPGWAAVPLALSVLLTWLYLRTGRSVLIVTLFHGSVDTVGALLFRCSPAGLPAAVAAGGRRHRCMGGRGGLGRPADAADPALTSRKGEPVSTVLVTGGTGLLGRAVVAKLAASGHDARIMTRRSGRPGQVVGDLATGVGLDAAVYGVAAIVHLASAPRDARRVDVAGTRRLIEAAHRAGRPHLVYVSIVGVDRIPMRYYGAKAIVEQDVAASGLPWTVLRATQFHEFAVQQLGRLTRLPVVAAPHGWRFQPVDVPDVAAKLVAAVDDGPGGCLPDLGGPDVLTVAELVRRYLRAARRRRPVAEVPVPGRLSAAWRSGAGIAPDGRSGGRTFDRFLAARFDRVHPASAPNGRTS